MQQESPIDNESRDSILLVANYESDVGYAWWLMENFWALIASVADKTGRKCVLAYPTIGRIPDVIANSSIESVELKVSPIGLLNAFSTARFIRKRRIRSVYVTDWPYLSWIYFLWRAAGARYIVMHDHHTRGDRPPRPGIRGLLKYVLQRLRVFSCDLYVGVSPYIGLRLVNNAQIDPHRCAVIQNGVRVFPLDTSRREEIRQAINVPNDALMIVLVSRASYTKGLDFAVKVMAKLRMAGTTNIYAVHCGGGTELPEFETLADNLGAADQFRFLGARDDVHDILCAADAAFHPSESEAMSLAILEFMCAALPVLVPDRPSVSQTVEHEKTGLIYRHQDEDSAVGAIHRLSQNREFRLQLGVTARARCLDRYTVERANADFERLVATRLCA